MLHGVLYKNGKCLIPHVLRTERWPERMRGLLGHAPLRQGEGLLIAPCNSVHTLAMRYDIDVLFLTLERDVIKLSRALRPWRATGAWQAASVLELLAGETDRLGICIGDRLEWRTT